MTGTRPLMTSTNRRSRQEPAIFEVLTAEPDAAPMIAPSQGVHLVFDGVFLSGESAIMVPHTRDGRVLFAIPWLGHTLVVVCWVSGPRPAGWSWSCCCSWALPSGTL